MANFVEKKITFVNKHLLLDLDSYYELPVFMKRYCRRYGIRQLGLQKLGLLYDVLVLTSWGVCHYINPHASDVDDKETVHLAM
jgi:hypothetical protein